MVRTIIETEQLTKMYGPHVALDEMSLKINSGATGLLGPNGAGKSTLIKTLLGLIQLTSGEGKVLGYNIRTEGDNIRQRIGYMPSTGMMQATKLACAIIHDPELLICDEPTNGLDSKARGFMLDTLFQVVKQGDRSILMSSHLMEDVERICDRIVMIHKGKLIAQGKIEDLKAIDREIEIWVWGGATKMEEALKDANLNPRRTGRVMRVVRQDDNTYDLVLEIAAKVGVQIRRMEDYEPSLEDLFLVIMDRLGYGVKSSSDLLQSQPKPRSVAPQPSRQGGGI